MSVFGGLTSASIELLLERARSFSMTMGGRFFEEGDSGNSAFVLERGRVAIVKCHADEEYFLRELVAGDCFGEVALMDFCPRSATVVAVEDCDVLEFHARDLLELSRKDPDQFSLVYMNIGRELARRLREANELLFRARIKYSDVAETYAFRST
jgi:CRP-like cAMP-binding protein